MQLTVRALTLFSALAAATPGLADEPLSKGEYVARAANCLVCHTMPGGRPYAGGLRMNTPVGAIYATNITPDADTGIGKYSYEDFEKAVRHGVRKDGSRLYPAMPYPSYARLGDADTRDLFDFFMKEAKPARQSNTPNEISGLYSMRWTLGMWNWLGGGGPFRPNPEFDAEWNRGAWIVQGPGHCGACHTPRGWLFQEKALDDNSGAFLAGGVLDNWSAPNLRGDLNTGLGRWSEDEIFDYLKKGYNRWGAAFGTMREVVTFSTSHLSDSDVKAMAKYLKSLSPSIDRAARVWVYNNATLEALNARKFTRPGSATFARQCASCHGMDGRGGGALPALAGNPAVLDPDPASLINIVVNGAAPLDGEAAGDSDWMPQFRTFLSDGEIADVVTFIRSAWGNSAAATEPARVKDVRQSTIPGDRAQILHMR